ncbi:MAG: hypothetical protein V7L04_17585 [Nostoc sp.]|uniref:hypothetical protein n=1 Tax=Nostoc sp. TaxID=1180 RepID=UPI002FFB0CAC
MMGFLSSTQLTAKAIALKGCFPRSLLKTRTRSLIQLMPNRDRLLTDFPKYDRPLD